MWETSRTSPSANGQHRGTISYFVCDFTYIGEIVWHVLVVYVSKLYRPLFNITLRMYIMFLFFLLSLSLLFDVTLCSLWNNTTMRIQVSTNMSTGYVQQCDRAVAVTVEKCDNDFSWLLLRHDQHWRCICVHARILKRVKWNSASLSLWLPHYCNFKLFIGA